MELARIRSVAFVDKGYNIALGFITVREVCKQLLTVLVDVRLFSSIVTVFVYQRTNDGILVLSSIVLKSVQLFALTTFHPHQKQAFNLVVQFITVGNDNDTAVNYVSIIHLSAIP